jgi:hypothetical protein
VEKVIEACAARVNIGNNYFIILCVYRSPCGDPEEFIKQLELILKFVFKPKLELIICGDFNINFLEKSTNSLKFDALLQTYNLYRVVDFPTRITNNSFTAIDSIFLDYNRLNSSHAFSVINRLSDHDAQYLTVSNMVNHQRNKNGLVKRRVICEAGIITCNQMLSRKTLDSVLSIHDVNKSFNSFLSIF